MAENVVKWASRLLVQIEGETFNPMDLISIFELLHAFKMTCDYNWIHEGADMWWIRTLGKVGSRGTNTRFSFKSSRRSRASLIEYRQLTVRL